MCFSAAASFTAAGVTGIVGVATLRYAKSRDEWPLASIPLLFSAQQLTEGFVWLSFQNQSFTRWNFFATFTYSLFSHVLWPTLVPIAILGVESNLRRRGILKLLTYLGLLVSGYQLFFMLYKPVNSEIVNHSIGYNYHHHFPVLTMALYLISVTLSGLVSSDSLIRLFGVTLLFSFGIAYSAFTFAFFSVWCFFGAALSLILFFYFRRRLSVRNLGVFDP
jgi:hypothetical protein